MMKKKANSPVVQAVQLESPLERLSDCRTVPYLRFFLVRNEEAEGSNPLSSTISQKVTHVLVRYHVLDPSNDATLAQFLAHHSIIWRSRNGHRQLAPPSESR